tara:strand:- start:246 stop:518 length:273 start_codon:yes stop_codon:yes gene_type:complete
MDDEPKLELSDLSQEITSGERTVSVEIYRLEGDVEWALEIVDEFNNSTVWDDTFPTESAALTEAKKAILEERVTSFIGPENGKSDGGHWK